MEKYFKNRIQKHTNRVPTHPLLYDSILKRMLEEATAGINVIEDGCCSVPSLNNGESYEVCSHTVASTCLAGNSGASCKHQALVRKN